jgi:streptomycin 6-kinase
MVASSERIVVPGELAASQARYNGAAGRAWIAALPELAATYLDRWQLRLDGLPSNGMVALVLPVLRADGTPAALKLQSIDSETADEAHALRAWDGQGAVRLLDHDLADLPRDALGSVALLLERLDSGRPLESLPDDLRALQILSELLARLVAVTAPPGLRRLGDIAERMLDRVPRVLRAIPEPRDRHLVRSCAAAVAELLPTTSDQLLHWDLHYGNILAGEREPWLAIDPKPLAGDPGFELLPALHNRWPDIVVTGDMARAVRRRFDLMVEVLGLDRRRATGWTLGRVLQNLLWEVEGGSGASETYAIQLAIVDALLARR